jgi:hypothetical protein
MTENRESATGKIRQSKGAATFFFLYFYFSLVYFIFFCARRAYIPQRMGGLRNLYESTDSTWSMVSLYWWSGNRNT